MEFVNLPRIHRNRSKFLFRPSNTTTMNVGDLVPLYAPIEVIPGDTWKSIGGQYIRLTPMVEAVFDNLYFDVFCFYVPFRLLWTNYKYFYGENKQDPYDSINTYSIPKVKIPTGGYEVGTIANYFGIRLGVGSTEENEILISALPFRAYSLIVNEFFLADYLNTKANTNYDIDAVVSGSNGDNYVTDLVLGGKPFVAAKLHDKFTSCLPRPQAGDSVSLNLGDNAPVYGGDPLPNTYFDGKNSKAVSFARYVPSGDYWGTLTGQRVLNTDENANLRAAASTNTGSLVDGGLVPNNLYSDLSNATAMTINDLRNAVAIQHLLESESRHGNRYFEQLVGDYGVISDDLTLQRPEYLGGSRFVLNVNQVVQTSETNTTPQGNVSAYSVTMQSHHDFTKSFKEPGYIIILGCCRYHHSYAQGLNKLWTKFDKYDFYNYHFEGMGELPIFNKEIFMSGTSEDDEVFGYMPYATEYRNLENMITGEMSPDYSQSLDAYHYGDNYSETPRLSSEWLREDKGNVDRTLVYQSSSVMQLQCQFSFNFEAYRPLSVYGIPGLRRL